MFRVGGLLANGRGVDCCRVFASQQALHTWRVVGAALPLPSAKPTQMSISPAHMQVPISATRAINRFCLIRNFATSPLLDGFARRCAGRARQDPGVLPFRGWAGVGLHSCASVRLCCG